MPVGLVIPTSVSVNLQDAAVESLRLSLDRLQQWAATVPEQSKFYMNKKPVLRSTQAPGRSDAQFEFNLAASFFDLHSVLASQCLVRTWRASQLMEGLTDALRSWNITMAAAATRALVETASAWFIESNEIVKLWKISKKRRMVDLDDIHLVRTEMYEAVTQMFAGSRLPHIVKISKNFQRTNILTLIQKASKNLGCPAIWDQYEVLCDAVHPSWGSSECFWAEVGLSEEYNQARVLLNKTSVGQPGDASQTPIIPGSGLGATIIAAFTWACDRLATDLEEFERMCRDVCLTCRIFTLSELDYWKVIQPTGAYHPCACGSGKKTRFCVHDFG